jgi:chromosome segregation ATPase
VEAGVLEAQRLSAELEQARMHGAALREELARVREELEAEQAAKSSSLSVTTLEIAAVRDDLMSALEHEHELAAASAAAAERLTREVCDQKQRLAQQQDEHEGLQLSFEEVQSLLERRERELQAAATELVRTSNELTDVRAELKASVSACSDAKGRRELKDVAALHDIEKAHLQAEIALLQDQCSRLKGQAERSTLQAELSSALRASAPVSVVPCAGCESLTAELREAKHSKYKLEATLISTQRDAAAARTALTELLARVDANANATAAHHQEHRAVHDSSSHVPCENVAVEAHTAVSGPAPAAALVEERLQARVSDLHAQLIVEARRHEVRSRSRVTAHCRPVRRRCGRSGVSAARSIDRQAQQCIDRLCANGRAHMISVDLCR